MNLYKDVGCSQEDHLINCSHFGFAGTYLSDHAPWCGEGRTSPCICNPKVRDPRDTWQKRYKDTEVQG